MKPRIRPPRQYIYCDRIEIVSPGSWLLPKSYAEYPLGSILSIRRNTIIAACLDEANLMERGGTGFQTMIESYEDCDEQLQPVVSIYPGFLNLRLYDRLYEEKKIESVDGLLSDSKIVEMSASFLILCNRKIQNKKVEKPKIKMPKNIK